MDLANEPGFIRQTRIFLQSRTLLMLKNEAVDTQIKVTDAQIASRYDERFVPRWLVQRLQYKDEETAMAAWQELAQGSMKVDEVLARNAEIGGPVSTSENWVRPNEIDPGWTAIFKKTTVGTVVDPSEHEKGAVLYLLKEQKGGDAEDMAKFREEIQKSLWKEQEDALSWALLVELRKKYQVQIDEERLAALDINNTDMNSFSDAPVITTSQQNFSEKEFMAVMRRLMANRTQFSHVEQDEELLKLKKETANNIIAQSVTNWESLDRHYETKEPFKWEYEFNYNHRLILALEQRLFVPEAVVTEEEIKQHFQENIARYTQPTVVKLYIIDEKQAPIDQIWADVAVGKKFAQVAKQELGVNLAAQEVPANHLDPEVKVVVDKLVDGETSQIFIAQGIRVMAHLIERISERPLPLERVKESIRNTLWNKKITQVRKTYLDTIKSRSQIEVQQRKWKEIQKELGGAS